MTEKKLEEKLDKRKEEKTRFFIGSKEVKQFSINEEIDLVGVLFADNSEDNFTIRQWNNLKSETPYDDSFVTQRKFSGLVQDILRLMLNENIMLCEKDTVLSLIDMSLVENYNEMLTKTFGVKEMTLLRMSQIENQLKSLSK